MTEKCFQVRILLLLAAGVTAASRAVGAAGGPPAALPKRQRVFFTGHSFHFHVPAAHAEDTVTLDGRRNEHERYFRETGDRVAAVNADLGKPPLPVLVMHLHFAVIGRSNPTGLPAPETLARAEIPAEDAAVRHPLGGVTAVGDAERGRGPRRKEGP